jgi:hypothetical protein
MRDAISLKDYGAVGDGATDDTAAVTAALTYIANNGLSLFVPAGIYRCTAKITISGTTNISIQGEGPEVSQFVFEGGDVGLDLTTPERTDAEGGASSLHGFSILKNSDVSTWGGTGLKFTTGTVSGGNSSLTLAIDSVTVGGRKGDTTFVNRFENSIHLLNCWQALLSNIYICGAIPLNDSTNNYGILFEDSTGCRCTNVLVYRHAAAYRVSGTTEGPTLTNCHGVGVRDGIFVEAPDGVDPSNPGLDVSNCHFNVTRYGIYAANRAQGLIHGCLFYEFDNNDEAAYKCIYTTGTSRQWVVANNVMTAKTGTAATTKIAVHLSGTGDNIVCNNQIRASTFTKGVLFSDTVTRSACIDNLMDADSDILFENNSTTPKTIRYRGAYAAGAPTSIALISTQTIPNTTSTLLAFGVASGIADATQVDDGAIVRARMVVPDYARRVRMQANVQWDASATGYRQLTLKLNGSAIAGGAVVRVNAVASGVTVHGFTSAPIDVVPGDYFTLEVAQTSGGNLGLNITNNSWLSMEIVA